MRKIIPEGKFRYLRVKEKKKNYDGVKIAKLKWEATFKSFEWDRIFFKSIYDSNIVLKFYLKTQ